MKLAKQEQSGDRAQPHPRGQLSVTDAARVPASYEPVFCCYLKKP